MKDILRCKDFTVSGEEFDLIYDETLEMLVTSPQPSVEKLAGYYESDDYISHTDSSKSIFDRVYQVVKKYALRSKIILVGKNSVGTEVSKSLLDIGCGTGDFLAIAKLNNWNVSGVEPNEKARSIAESKLDISVFFDISEIGSQKYDCITLWHVLEHIPDLQRFIANLKHLLEPNGLIIVAVPNFKSFDANYYKNNWAAYDVPRHLWHFSQTSIAKLFHMEHMKVKSVVPMKFDAFYVSILSEKYKSNPFGMIKGFFVGLVSNIKAMFSKEYSSLIYVLKEE
ncbi:class I SAM-dependent methyltransferase [Urechidicola vernalis]|uniref:Class I SAM-dependent methyltransferase n=1 Tax=Urechidicola vernalis TaxID=3075600 RepID=A0ABU2Y976_9FLAO|nr:class I SAM-dependent methyltransferase [Urechidicola sp. P050]MDT0553618.1 class I SAM-dependent methyltransferase [Urechidicola sp. P050]